MKNYFTPPPKPKKLDVPSFMYKRYNTNIYNTEYVMNLIQWAELEYLDSVAWFTNTFQYDKLNVLKKYNWMTLLATTNEFRDLSENMTDGIWESFPKSIKNIVADVYNLMLKLQ